jgi:hypothetical protein
MIIIDKKMSENLSRNYLHWLKRKLLENIFPTNEEEFNFSQYEKWLNRIEQGKEAELQHLSNIADDSPDEVYDMYADDIAESDAISNDMYAAMCVHLWSKIEISFARCIMAWNLEAISEVNFDTYKINKVSDFFIDTAGIPLDSITNYQFVNALRVLSNCYKHSNGRYEPGNYPIDPSLLNQWDIEEGHRIDYLRLPLKDILLRCGEFLKELLDQVRQKIETSH